MDLERRDGESALQYHKRLVYGKLDDKTLSDYDYSELSERLYGKAYSSDVARRMLYGSKKTLDLIGEEAAAQSGDDISQELDEKMVELRKERQKFYDQRMAYSKMVRDRAREEELNDIIQSCIRAGELPVLPVGDKEPPFGPMPYGDSDLLVSLNDIHYGACFRNAWRRYDSDVFKRALCDYLDKIVEITELHHCENCTVWAAGDLISGSIHRSIQVTNKENVIEQVIGVSELIAWFLSELSKHFRTVRFVSVAGNHSRIEPNKENSLVSERLDNLVEWYLEARLQNIENIEINSAEHKLDETMSMFSIRGKNYCMVHGDFDGSYGKVQSLQTMVRQPLYAVLCGHKHHNATDNVQGVRTVMAGSFQGMDSFCVEKRIYGVPEQMVCVCDENGIRCHYDIDLS